MHETEVGVEALVALNEGFVFRLGGAGVRLGGGEAGDVWGGGTGEPVAGFLDFLFQGFDGFLEGGDFGVLGFDAFVRFLAVGEEGGVSVVGFDGGAVLGFVAELEGGEGGFEFGDVGFVGGESGLEVLGGAGAGCCFFSCCLLGQSKLVDLSFECGVFADEESVLLLELLNLYFVSILWR